MAEINVPAWPIPIHQTKFVIANPQATPLTTLHLLRSFATTAPSSARKTHSAQIAIVTSKISSD